MPSLKLSNPFRRGADRPSLKQRAASLKASAARVMKGKPADPLAGTTCPDGFVPYPFDSPTSYASIGSVVIQAEAQRLLDLALDEYERVCGSFADHVSEERRESIRQANRVHLRLDALSALVKDQPKPCGEAGNDLAFAAIEEHRAAWAAWKPHLDAISEIPCGLPAYDAAEAAGEESRLRDGAAFQALISTRPTTIPGLLALAEYVPGAIAQDGCSDSDDPAVMGLATVCAALRSLVPHGGVELPAISAARETPDAALLALGTQWRAARAAYEAASERAVAIEEVCRVRPPEALYEQPSDAALGIARYASWQARDERNWYWGAASDLPFGASTDPITGCFRHGQIRTVTRPAVRARLVEICAAYDQHTRDIAEEKASAGLPEAEAEATRLFNEEWALETAILALTAHTLPGLRVQAEVALVNEDHQEGQDMAWAIVRGLLKVA